MSIKNSRTHFAFALVTVLAMLFSTANASPQKSKSNKSRNTANTAQAKTQIQQMEATYQELLSRMDRKPEILNASFTLEKKAPKQIKTAYSPRSGREYNNRLHVTATAYTSHANQTDSTPNIAAWGDRLKPGMKAIAVSRDLLHEYGLKHKQKVRIKGLEGEYVVLDKMNKRWRKKIDIYMGRNLRKAFKWGRRKVEIHWD